MNSCRCWARGSCGSLGSFLCRSLLQQRCLTSSSLLEPEQQPRILQRFTLPPGSSSRADATGLSVWGTAKPLLKHLKEHVLPSFQEKKLALRVLELGAGTGVVGMGLASSEKLKVVLTDHSDAIDWLSQNVEMNRKLLGDRAMVVPLTWGDERHISNILSMPEPNFDFIVGSDLTYNPNSHEALLMTLKRLSIDESLPAFLGFPPRSLSEERFLELLRDEGFDVNVEALDDKGKAMLAIARRHTKRLTDEV